MYFKHKKTGNIYRLINSAICEATMDPVIIYMDAESGLLWTRPATEFYDGRFEVYIPVADFPGDGSLH